MLALVINNKIVHYPYPLQQFKVDNPNVSLPETPTAEQLAEVDLYEVSYIKPPVITYKQNLISITPVLLKSRWFQQWEIVDATPEEIAQREESMSQENKTQAMQLLTETDWTQMPDVDLLNKQEFVTYRAELRIIAINAPIDVVFPIKPQEIWA